MEMQRARARAAQKKEVISLSQIETTTPTKFVGYEKLETPAKVLEVVGLKDKTAIILDTSACYAEMGGQVGDTGEILVNRRSRRNVSRRTLSDGADSRPRLQVTNTQKSGNTWLHFVTGENIPATGDEVFFRLMLPAATPSSATTPSRICCTGRCTKSSARKLRRKARSSARTS